MNMRNLYLGGGPALPAGPAVDEIEKEWVYAAGILLRLAREWSRLLVVREERHVGHALRIEHAVQVVALMLKERSPRAECVVLDRLSVERLITDVDVEVARHLAV